MSKVSTGSGPRLHYFNLVFANVGQQQGVISRVIQFPHPRVSHAQLAAIRDAEGISHNAPLLAVNYLGRMSRNEWESSLWEPEEPAPAKNSGCLVPALVGLCVALAGAAACWWVLNP